MQKEKTKSKIGAGKIIARVSVWFTSSLAFILIAAYVLLAVVAHGPSTTMRDALVQSAMQASATKWVPRLFLSKATVQKIVDDSFIDSKLTVDMDSYGDENAVTEDEWANAIDGVKYIEAGYTNFKAYIMLVRDPKRVYTGTSSNNYQTATQGMRIFDLVAKEDVLACINAGGFLDEGGMGTGATPTGMTYSKGVCAWNEKSNMTFIGFDKNDKLVVSEGMSKDKAEALGVRDGVSFKNGNVLIDSDENGVNIYYKNKNTGAAQRTAIGQRADGTVILVVTDGRTASSIGATYNDIIDIMVSYGAVAAGMLDGGSSSMMYYENYYEKYNMDTSKLDDYQKKGLVNKYRAFYPPRKIPTYFCVSR